MKRYIVKSLAEVKDIPPPAEKDGEQVRITGPGFVIIQNPSSPNHVFADLFKRTDESAGEESK